MGRGLAVAMAVALATAACADAAESGDDGPSGNVVTDGTTTSVTAAPDERACDVPVEEVLGRMNDATFAVVGEARPTAPDGSPGEPVYFLIGTAWAVGDQLMATNAHVTEAYRSFAEQGVQLTDAIAVQSRTGSVVRLLEAATHPGYDGDPLGSPDVGLFTTEEVLPVVLPLATDPDVRLGDEILIVGFPGDVNDFITIVPGVTVPQATSLSGRVTALRSHDLTLQVTAENLDVVQHQAPTTPGTSGSSMIACDEVIAVNNAGTVQLVVTPDPDGGDFRIDRAAAAANNFAVHVRHLRTLLDQFEGGQVQRFALPVPAAQAPPPPPPEPEEEEFALAGTWTGQVVAGTAEHRFAFAIDEQGVIIGLSEWAQTGQFELNGRLNPDGTFTMVDNAPERLGYRRGTYEGQFDMAGNAVGTYFEETLEDQRFEFLAQRTR